MPYKLVRLRSLEEGFTSLTRTVISGGVIYEVGKPTRPQLNCGPLAAFKTLRDVREFQRRHGGSIALLFKCRIKKETEVMELFVSDKYDAYSRFFTDVLPNGTILCKEITLTKRI